MTVLSPRDSGFRSSAPADAARRRRSRRTGGPSGGPAGGWGREHPVLRGADFDRRRTLLAAMAA
ncbi:hypothetical protein ABZX88_22790, partial [Kitasatospora aureofaciens]|uniref:hypothetical protein n=1 Tax=Kitasatospora aureofaciens TaxID=1894 RepID=UPI0033BBEDB7